MTIGLIDGKAKDGKMEKDSRRTTRLQPEERSSTSSGLFLPYFWAQLVKESPYGERQVEDATGGGHHYEAARTRRDCTRPAGSTTRTQGQSRMEVVDAKALILGARISCRRPWVLVL